MFTRSRPLVLAALACVSALLSACRVGGYSKPERENETLRKDVKSLSEQLALATAERDELRIKLRHAVEPSAGTPAADVLAATPKIVALEIDSFSGYVPADERQPATGIVAYIRTLDGRRRFTQAVGTLTVEIWNKPTAFDSGDAPISRVTLGPTQLREAYRSSLTGTHYAVELLFPSPLVRDQGLADGAVLRATYVDAITNESVHTEYPLPASAPSQKAKKSK